MSKRATVFCMSVVLLAPGLTVAQSQELATGPLTLSAKKHYPWDNPLHSELAINGKTVNIYSSDTSEPVAEHFKEGWNTITIKTTPQEPATKNNGLTFLIGPIQESPDRKQKVMTPVLWEFRNDTDWKFAGGKYSHPLGPDMKEVTLSYSVYYGGMQHENAKIKAGDFVLTAKPYYADVSRAHGSWNSPVTATAFVNGTVLNTWMIAARDVVITSLLKQGKNEIKLVSTRVKNSIRANDIVFQVLGPAEWNVTKGEYVLPAVVEFKGMEGWIRDSKSGQLVHPSKPASETVERTIPFFLKEAPKVAEK